MNQCPICNNPSPVLKYKLTFNIFKCKDCGFLFCPDAKFDKSFISDLNEESREKSLKQLRKENFQKIVLSIKKHISHHTIGLEVGCGYGWFLETCIENNLKCDGIEPETRFNKYYKSIGLNIKNDFYPLELSQNIKYDFIVFNDVIEHIPNISEIMNANYSLLNSDGLLIINLPIQEGIVYFFAKLAYYLGFKSLLNRMWQFNFHSPHLYYFTKKNILEFVSAHKFKLVESYKLKTINISEISDRIKLDNKQGLVKFIITYIGVLCLYPFLKLFPDTYCFVFKK